MNLSNIDVLIVILRCSKLSFLIKFLKILINNQNICIEFRYPEISDLVTQSHRLLKQHF